MAARGAASANALLAVVCLDGDRGIVGIATGVIAGSIALTGFGINSFVEGFASVVIVWRFTGSRLHSEKEEVRAHRIVAIQFFILAPYVA